MLGIWVVVVVISLVIIGVLLDSATTTDFSLADRYESERAAALLEDRLRGPKPVTELVIVQSPTLNVDDPEFQEMVESLHDEIMALGPDKVELGVHYYLSNDPISVSPDRKTTILAFVLAGTTQEATGNVEDVVHIVQEANEAADFRVLIGGDASVAFENNEMSAADLEKGERFGIPIALIILLVLFGTIVAIFLPLGIAIVAIMLALAAVGVIGQFFQLIFFVTMMITMIGLAVGIDYSLLIVSRFREEMSSGLDKQEAISKTGDTAGRTVLFSGTTVVVALLGMLIVPVSFFQSLGLGAILVVIAALAATLTLLPAVLSLLGSRVNFLSIPFLARFSLKGPQTTEHGCWVAVTRVVARYPIVSILLIGVPLIAGVTSPEDRRKLAGYVYRISRGLIGRETADRLMYPPHRSFGVVAAFWPHIDQAAPETCPERRLHQIHLLARSFGIRRGRHPLRIARPRVCGRVYQVVSPAAL